MKFSIVYSFIGINDFEEYFDKRIFEAEDEFDRTIAELAAQGKDSIVRKDVKGLRVSTAKNAVRSSNRPQLSMSHRNLERIRNEYISDQSRKKDIEANIKERQKKKALNARRRKKLEAQLLKTNKTKPKIDMTASPSKNNSGIFVDDVHNEFRQDSKRRFQEAELIKHKQLENTKKKINDRRKRNNKVVQQSQRIDESNFEFI